jgi:hypothetical protein
VAGGVGGITAPGQLDQQWEILSEKQTKKWKRTRGFKWWRTGLADISPWVQSSVPQGVGAREGEISF